MTNRARVHYEAAILCDDIRLEHDGKRTLVGVYTGDVVNVPYLPFKAGFFVYATGHVISEGEFYPSLKITNSDEAILYEDKSEGSVMLKEGRFTQNLLVQWEIFKIGAFQVTLFDRDDALASMLYAIGIWPIGSSDFRGAL